MYRYRYRLLSSFLFLFFSCFSIHDTNFPHLFIQDLEQARLKTPPASEDEEEDEGASIGPRAPANLQEEKTSREELKRAQKRKHTREWDMGKEGVKSTLSQEEWVLRQREQRNSEFAPPTLYEPSKQRHSKQNSRPSSTNPEMGLPDNTGTDSQAYRDPALGSQDCGEPSVRKEERRNEFAPPATYEYYGPASSKRRDNYRKPGYKAMENAITQGLSNLRKMCDS